MSLSAWARCAAAFAGLVVMAQAGALIAHLLHLPVPAYAIGILLLLAALFRLGRVPHALLQVARLLLAHLNLFYIPAGVGLMAHIALLRRDLFPISFAILISTFLALAAGALAFRLVADWTEKR